MRRDLTERIRSHRNIAERSDLSEDPYLVRSQGNYLRTDHSSVESVCQMKSQAVQDRFKLQRKAGRS